MKRFDQVRFKLPEGKLMLVTRDGTARVQVKDANGDNYICIVPIEYVEPVESHPVM